MPTPLKQVLGEFSEQELESFARDKIEDFEHIRLPKSVLIDELFSLFTNQSYLRDKLAYRSPPSYEILHTLLNNKGYSHDINGFKTKVLKKTDELVNRVRKESRIGSGEHYDLYLKMLRTAWHHGEEINSKEANLLETLRAELNLTFEQHFILEHHPDIKDLWDRGSPFKRERNHLLQSGIVYTHGEENCYLVPEEIAYQILDLWGIELDHEDYDRLLNYLQKRDLITILEELDLRVSGTKKELARRIINHHIPVSKGLSLLNKNRIREVCKKVGCKSSGSKSQIVNRLIQYIQYDRDLETDEQEEQKVTLPEEEKTLSEKKFNNLFNVFTTDQLYHLLSEIPTTVTYGSKSVKINRLWDCTLSEPSLLERMKKRHLSDACSDLGLKVSGTKDELIKRILQQKKKEAVPDQAPSKEQETKDDSHSDVRQKQKTPDKEQTFDDVPNFNKVGEEFPFLDQYEKIVLASLIEFGSITEQDIDRIVAKYDLPWLFPKQEMEQLITSLQENGHDIIEVNELQEHNWYKIHNIEG